MELEELKIKYPQLNQNQINHILELCKDLKNSLENDICNWIAKNILNHKINLDRDQIELQKLINFYKNKSGKIFTSLKHIQLEPNIKLSEQEDIQNLYKEHEVNVLEQYDISLEKEGNFEYIDVIKKWGDYTLIKSKDKIFTKLLVYNSEYLNNKKVDYFVFCNQNVILSIDYIMKYLREIETNEDNGYSGWDEKYDSIILQSLTYIGPIEDLFIGHNIRNTIYKRPSWVYKLMRFPNVKLNKRTLCELYNMKTKKSRVLETLPKYIWDKLTQKEKIKYNVKLSGEDVKGMTEIEKYLLEYDSNDQIFKYYRKIADELKVCESSELKSIIEKYNLKFVEIIYLINQYETKYNENKIEIMLQLDEIKNHKEIKKYEFINNGINFNISDSILEEMYGINEYDIGFLFNDIVNIDKSSEIEYSDRYFTEKSEKLMIKLASDIGIKIEEIENEESRYYYFLKKIRLDGLFDDLFYELEEAANELLKEKQKEIMKKLPFEINYYRDLNINITYQPLLDLMLKKRYKFENIFDIFKTEIISIGNLDDELQDYNIMSQVDITNANKNFQENFEYEFNEKENYLVQKHIIYKNVIKILNDLHLTFGKNTLKKGNYTIKLKIDPEIVYPQIDYDEKLDENEIKIKINREVKNINGEVINKSDRLVNPKSIHHLLEIELFD